MGRKADPVFRTTWQLRRDEVGLLRPYANAHARVYKAKGKAANHECAMCPNMAEQWAYNHEDSEERVGENGLIFSDNPDYYIALCRSCHWRFDYANTQMV